MTHLNFNDNGFEDAFKQVSDSSRMLDTGVNTLLSNQTPFPIQLYTVQPDSVKTIQNGIIRGYMPVEIQINDKPKKNGLGVTTILFIGAFIFLIYKLYNHFRSEIKKIRNVRYYLDNTNAQNLSNYE